MAEQIRINEIVKFFEEYTKLHQQKLNIISQTQNPQAQTLLATSCETYQESLNNILGKTFNTIELALKYYLHNDINQILTLLIKARATLGQFDNQKSQLTSIYKVRVVKKVEQLKTIYEINNTQKTLFKQIFPTLEYDKIKEQHYQELLLSIQK